VPCAELVANVLVDTHGPETDRLVECHTGGIGQGDPGIGIPVTLTREDRKQRHVQPSSDAATMPFRVHVDRGIDRPSIRWARAMLGGIRVTRDLSVDLADEPRVRPQRVGNPAGHLGGARRERLERNRGVLDDRAIDGRDAGAIRFAGKPDVCRHTSPPDLKVGGSILNRAL